MSSRSTSRKLGVPAPPLELPAAGGERRSLAEFRGRPVIVSFLGPANCLFCRGHVLKMVSAKDRIQQAGVEVIFVAFHDPDLMMSKMLRDLDLSFVLLLDRAREAYARWGLQTGTLKAFLNPGFFWALVKLLLTRPRSLGAAPPHHNQLGGDFVVDRAGNLVFVNRMRSIHDRAAIDDMLAAVR
ncbi:MAG TPA: redoxin domain-containing protein [Vicinamibacterales bacterium]|nr:redoxin domain-containing protein [Vicinamibacterales bacterium]